MGKLSKGDEIRMAGGWKPKDLPKPWTPRERQLAHFWASSGYSNAEIGKRLGRTTKAVGAFFRRDMPGEPWHPKAQPEIQLHATPRQQDLCEIEAVAYVQHLRGKGMNLTLVAAKADVIPDVWTWDGVTAAVASKFIEEDVADNTVSVRREAVAPPIPKPGTIQRAQKLDGPVAFAEGNRRAAR